MCAKAVKSYALLNITAKGSPLAEIYTKGCFLKVRNFKKTLSLVLSVLMLVCCCSVVFSTFATAYTTNDGTTPNYGVYTYDFLTKDADGNVVEACPVGMLGTVGHSVAAHQLQPGTVTEGEKIGAEIGVGIGVALVGSGIEIFHKEGLGAFQIADIHG